MASPGQMLCTFQQFRPFPCCCSFPFAAADISAKVREKMVSDTAYAILKCAASLAAHTQQAQQAAEHCSSFGTVALHAAATLRYASCLLHACSWS